MYVVDHGFLKRTDIDGKIGYGNVQTSSVSCFVRDRCEQASEELGEGGGVASTAERLVKENYLKLFDVIENLLSIKFTVSVKR